MTLGRERPSRVAILVHSVLARDPRVRRQIETLAHLGYEVCALGHSPFPEDSFSQGAQESAVPSISWRQLPLPPAGQTARVWRVLEKLPGRVSARWADAITARWPTNRAALDAMRNFRPDVIHANDWPTLPVAAKLKAETGCKLIYDTHEYAIEELGDNVVWRWTYRPHVRAIEKRNLPHADCVITVSEGIASALRDEYGLDEIPAVVRNVPNYELTPYRAPKDELIVLYQGLVAPGRGLEAIVESVAHWRPDRRLVIRGPGNLGFTNTLRAIAERLSLGRRVEFEPPVPANELIYRANTADIGVHPIPPINVQTDYCLPNKLFEYTMAGLCLCVSPAAEMARVVSHYDLGVVAASSSPADIAVAINSLETDRVAWCKRQSLAAAKELCWEEESRRLHDIYSDLLGVSCSRMNTS